jgi:hypothetical protein
MPTEANLPMTSQCFVSYDDSRNFGGGLSAPAAEFPPLERIAIIPLKGPVEGLDHLSLDA